LVVSEHIVRTSIWKEATIVWTYRVSVSRIDSAWVKESGIIEQEVLSNMAESKIKIVKGIGRQWERLRSGIDEPVGGIVQRRRRDSVKLMDRK